MSDLPFAARIPGGAVVIGTVSTSTRLVLSLDDARFLRDSLDDLIELDAAEKAAGLCVSDFREA